MRYKSNALIVFLCAAFLLNGCAFRRLKKDLSKLDELKPVSGTVFHVEGHSKPVVVILWALDDESRFGSGYWVVPQDGAFTFLRPGGRYYLFAFEDANEDARYQTNECATAFGSPTIIDLNSREKFENLELCLMAPGSMELPSCVNQLSVEEKEKKFEWRKGQVGIVTTMDNPDFTAKSGTLGLWQPLSFYGKFGMKIFFLEPYDPDKTPVLFVHGSSGHPGTWSTIIENMDREHFQPWLAFYPSGLRLEVLGDALSRYLSELHLEHKFDDMIVIAHSMGGLVSRSMIQKYAQQTFRCRVPVYITIATPWQGHAGAATGVKRAPAVVPAWYDMVPGNPFIRKIFSAPLPKEMNHYLFFAYRGKSGAKFRSENTDGTVSLSSQLFGQAQEEAFKTIGMNSTHVGILSDTNLIQHLNRILDAHRIQKAPVSSQ